MLDPVEFHFQILPNIMNVLFTALTLSFCYLLPMSFSLANIEVLSFLVFCPLSGQIPLTFFSLIHIGIIVLVFIISYLLSDFYEPKSGLIFAYLV